MKKAQFAPEAVLELAMLLSGYESRRQGLGAEFLQEFDTLSHLIQSRPASFPRLLNASPELNIRRALFPRFPFSAVFLEMPSEIRILAVAHVRRQPGYWLNRVKK